MTRRLPAVLLTGLFVTLANAKGESVIDLGKPVSASLPPDGVYWAFDDGTLEDSMPDPVVDGSGNAFSGLLLAGEKRPQPTYGKGRFGTAIHFQGNTPPETLDDGKMKTFRNPRVSWKFSDRPVAPDPSRLDMAETSFTAGGWIKLDEINGGNLQMLTLFHRGHTGGWMLRLIKDARDQWGVVFMGGGRAESEKVFVFNDLQWHHIGVVYDVQPDGNHLQFWLDGSPLGEPIPMEGSIAKTTPTDQIFTVGESNIGHFGAGFVGAVDDIFVTKGVHKFRESKSGN